MERLVSEVKEVFYIDGVTLLQFTFEFGPRVSQINGQFLPSSHSTYVFFIFFIDMLQQ